MKNNIAFSGICLMSNIEFEPNEIFLNLKKNWNLKINADTPFYEEKENYIKFKNNDLEYIIIFSNKKINEEEIIKKAQLNYYFYNPEEKVRQHNSHILLGVSGNKKNTEIAIEFTKLASACLDNPNAIAIYTTNNVIEAQEYIYEAEYIKRDYLPIEDWIYIGIIEKQRPLNNDYIYSLFTFGMKNFDKEEIEILDSCENIDILRNRILNISYYIIDNDVDLTEDETLTLNEKDSDGNIYPVKFKVSFNDGKNLNFKTLKIEKLIK